MVDVLVFMLSCLVLTTASCDNRDITAAEVLTYGGPDISHNDCNINLSRNLHVVTLDTAIFMCNALFNSLNDVACCRHVITYESM